MITKSDRIRFGCQTYTWQMSFEKYRGRIEHILSTVRYSGMSGLEPELCMLGEFATEPGRFRDCLQENKISLGALCLVCDWLDAKESSEEAAHADTAIAMLRDYFPESVLVLCQMPGVNRLDISRRQKSALGCINAVAERAFNAGLIAAFHPNSPGGSIFRTAEDYRVMLGGLDMRYIGFAPDSGHIAKGGMDPVSVIREAIPLVRHVHFKDMDSAGNWVEMGRGIIAFSDIVTLLKNAQYNGWIMVEDESALAETDPDAATLANGKFISQNFH